MSTPIVANRYAGSLRSSFSLDSTLRTWVDRHEQDGRLTLVRGRRLESSIEKLIGEGHGRIAVGGGDGTLSTAAELCTRHQVELVPLPMGTLNHFAKDLGISDDPEHWDELIEDGTVKDIDFGEVNGKTFLNNFSIGFYPALAKFRQEFTNERLLGSKQLATMWSALKTRVRTKPVKISIEAKLTSDSKNTTQRDIVCDAMMVSNNAYGFNTPLFMGRESLGQGQLVVYLVKDLTRVSLSEVVTKYWEQDFSMIEDGLEGVDIIRCVHLEATLKQPQTRIAIDGELVKARSPIAARIKPRALRVVVPAKASD